LIRDWERETDDLRLALETEVALDIDAVSWFIVGGSGRGVVYLDVTAGLWGSHVRDRDGHIPDAVRT